MPLIDSFVVDHTVMPAPAVRLAKIMKTPHGDEIEIWDLRFIKPNTGMMPEKGLHTFEHLFAGFMRDHLNEPGKVEVIDISPMGCKTGFYMSLVGTPSGENVRKALLASMQDIVALPKDFKIPAANPLQCGSYKLHSLAEAQDLASMVIEQGVVITDSADIMLSPDKLKDLE